MRPALGRSIRSFILPLLLPMVSVMPYGCVQEAPAPSLEHGVAVLTVLVHDPGAEIRRTAAESLGKIGDRSALPAVLPLLRDPAPAVRAAAAQALGRMASPGDEEAIAGLVRALQDPSDTVKRTAALAIGDIEPLLPQLAFVADLLRASDVQVRRAAVHTLLSVGSAQVAGWLLPLLNDPDVEVRQGAVAALGLSGDARAETALGQRLGQDGSPAVRAEAAYHLGKLRGQQTRLLLQTAVEKETDRGVRRWIEAELKAWRAND